MTPKEKAEELIQKTAISTSWGTNYTGGDDIPIYKNQYAKQCALIAVDEAINMFIGVHKKLIQIDMLKGDVEETATFQYWQEVKQEIEKL